MASIKSKKVTVNKPVSDVYNFLLDLNNLQKLMPEDKVDQWESTTDSCRFQVKGLASIGMRQEATETDREIKLVSEGKNPFPFTLTIHFEGNGESCVSYFDFDGKMNSFLRMMVEKPLGNFFNMLADKLPEAI